MRPAARRRVVAAVLALALPACTFGVRRGDPPRRTRSPGATVSVPPCRPSYAPPDPKRPRVTLSFDVDASYTTVTGTERVVFTPDRPVTELVFRLWLNGPNAADDGGRIEVTRASLPMRYEPAGAAAGTPGTLLRLALPAESPAGKAVTADLDFTITLPRASIDRWGRTAQTAWWASAHPMLAWVRGSGWDETPAVAMLGETAANETAVHDVTVVAPFSADVLSIGIPAEPVATAEGKRRWRFRNPIARDVAVSVGTFARRDVEMGGVPVRLAVSDEVATGPAADRVLDRAEALTAESMRTFTRLFGPFPYPSLSVVAIRAIASAGVEYPGLIWLGSRRYDVVVPHEVAHEWFYGLVGNDQGDDPWLDESFASYGEALVNEASGERYVDLVDERGAVGRPMAYWQEHRDDYGRIVYGKGAAALLLAREEAGRDAFDRLLRCFVRENAHRVVSPADVEKAFAPAPVVLDILRDAGAL